MLTSSPRLSLDLSYGDQEYVTVVLVSADEPGSRHRVAIDQRTARTGCQMRRALDLPAEAIRKKLVGQACRQLRVDTVGGYADIDAI